MYVIFNQDRLTQRQKCDESSRGSCRKQAERGARNAKANDLRKPRSYNDIRSKGHDKRALEGREVVGAMSDSIEVVGARGQP